MRSLKEIYPAYQARVAFLAVDVDPSEDLDQVRAYAEQQGYPWPVAVYEPHIAAAYKITSQATKIALDGEGTIVFRAGYGVESTETWRQVLEQLVGGRG